MDASDQRLVATFHRSIMLTAGISGLILCGAEGSLFPCGVTPVVAVIAWIFVDHLRRFHLPIILANGLGLLALAAAAWEFVSGNIESKLLSGAHLIVYLTWIVLFLEKTVRQYWWVIALSLLQLAVSAVLTSSAGFGASLAGMLLVLLWTLAVFSLYRVLVRRESALLSASAKSAAVPPERPLSGRIEVIHGLQREAGQPWITTTFRGLVMASFVVSLMLSLIVFTAFPRVWVADSPFAPGQFSAGDSAGLVSRTGFTDEVRLGDIGRVMQTHDRVLQFSVTRLSDGKPVSAEAFAEAMDMDELRFRGNAMGTYNKGAWSRGLQERGYNRGEVETDQFGVYFPMKPEFRLEVTQDPPVSRFAFAVFPISKANALPGSGRVFQRSATGSLIWSGGGGISPQVPRSFAAECPRAAGNPDATFEHWAISRLVAKVLQDRLSERRREFAEHLFLSDDLQQSLPKLYAISQTICSSPAEPLTERERADRILQYLSPDNGFRYSLSLTVRDPNVDPVEDFLLNTKTGHCEYFASACTLLLQASGIPARLVNGFYGSEVNTVSGKNEVKQHHAHTWVEAFIDNRWETLEPTPAAERLEDVSDAQSVTLLTDLSSAFSDLWTGGIHNMTLEKQRAFFDPVLQFGISIRDSIREQGLLATLKGMLQSFLTSPEAWFSWQGGLVSFLLLLATAGIARLRPLRRLRKLLARLFGRLQASSGSAHSVIRFYVRFCSVCAAHGLPVATATTAREHADLAQRYFADRLNDDYLKQVPYRIATAFNDVRFGEQTLDERQIQSISNDLDAFSQALQRPPSAATAST